MLKSKWNWEPTVRSIRWGFTICVFIILCITVAVYSSAEVILAYFGLLDGIDSVSKAFPLLLCALASLPIGTLVSFVFLHIPMRPIKKLLAGMTRLANGHFDERIDLGEEHPLKEMGDSFNSLAAELENTEVLRADFINNFSHEFKTPIVSINGFARLLQCGELSEEEKKEYIDIIAEESTRLANMANNILNLTKVENQTILADIHEFNLSEQVRHCILLLEKNWTMKNLEISADFQEYIVAGEANLLKQVWLNLLENAIKFSPEGSEVAVKINRKPRTVEISIINHGPVIPEPDQKRLFDKFWQGDKSHASDGAGVGLSIVKKIVDLHNGVIMVNSSEKETIFTVHLPA